METPTEVLIQTIEDFSRSEPTHLLILYLNEAGDLVYRSNIDSVIIRIGLCETAKSFFISDINHKQFFH